MAARLRERRTLQGQGPGFRPHLCTLHRTGHAGVVPFKAEYVIYTVLLIASMLSGYFDDAAETAWNEYKKA